MARTILQVVDFDSGGTRVRLSDGSFVTLPHGAQVPSIGAEYVSEPISRNDLGGGDYYPGMLSEAQAGSEPEPTPLPDPPPTEATETKLEAQNSSGQ
jgi:hypothetical protein